MIPLIEGLRLYFNYFMTDRAKGILRDSGFVQHGAQPERGYNAVLFF